MELLAQGNICESCGSLLDVEMPSGFCPGCLLNTVLKAEKQTARGTRIDDYELLDEVARGGMGIVYRARQQTPFRVVALKMILPAHLNSPGAVQRFRAEAEAAASLEHESILPIYAVGEADGAPFYSMKFAEGGTLSARIDNYRDKPRQAATLVAKLARAVGFAHKHGILHRDLKPGNVLFDSAGKPYVSDFGLAKWLQRECDLTQTLAILGTPYYMAPEQATDSRSVTAAADVYSLGAILYHMLTGHPPVIGDMPVEVLRRAAEQTPKRPRSTNPALPRDLEVICLKCLEKEPVARYASAAALADDLSRFCNGHPIQARRAGLIIRGRKWLQRNPTTTGLSASLLVLAVVIGWNAWQSEWLRPARRAGVAVLPFEDLSRDPDNAYFADGIQDDILTRLAKIGSLKVISRTSTKNYGSRPGNLREIARQLGVSNILEGGVQKVGSKVRVNVQLINASTDAHLWAETYDRELMDVFALESEIASRVADSLNATLTPEEKQRVDAIPTSNPDAYEAYLRAREMFRGADDSPKQKEYYERAVALDPQFALAYSGLSWWYCMDALGAGVTPENQKKARFAAEEALRLQPELGEAHFALGFYHYGFERNYEAAEKQFAIAARALPNDAELFRVWAIMKRRQGHWRAAIEGVQRSLSLDPRNLLTVEWMAGLCQSVRNYATAEEVRRREVELATSYSPEAAAVVRRRLVVLQWIRTGTLAPMQALFDELPKDFSPALRGQILGDLGYAKRDPDLVIEGTEISGDKQDLTQLFWLTQPLLVKGDVARANKILEGLIAKAEGQVKENPNEAIFHAKLGLFYAYRDRKDEAIREGRRAVDLLPESTDAAQEPVFESYLARIYARVGESDLALGLIEHLLTIPCEEDAAMSVRELQVDWAWDAIRNNPRFRKLLNDPPETIYN